MAFHSYGLHIYYFSKYLSFSYIVNEIEFNFKILLRYIEHVLSYIL